MNKTGIVLIHGAWHDHHTWETLVPLLEAAGCLAKPIDLPGAGARAAVPKAFNTRPIDLEAFSSEPSPNAAVSQDERTEAAIAAVREVNKQTGGKAVVVGHSLGGITVSPVAEAIPDEISAIVYLTAFLIPPGMLPVQMIQHQTMAAALVPGLFLADPQTTGALRIDVGSTDAAYRERIKSAFYADLTEAQFAAALKHMHPDEPAQVVGTPSAVTRENYGRVVRHYVKCLDDRAIMLAGQNEMIRLMDEAMGNATHVHEMTTSHSPFYSDPVGLAKILLEVAAQSTR